MGRLRQLGQDTRHPMGDTPWEFSIAIGGNRQQGRQSRLQLRVGAALWKILKKKNIHLTTTLESYNLLTITFGKPQA